MIITVLVLSFAACSKDKSTPSTGGGENATQSDNTQNAGMSIDTQKKGGKLNKSDEKTDEERNGDDSDADDTADSVIRDTDEG